MKKIKLIILTFILTLSFSIQSSSKTVPASFAKTLGVKKIIKNIINNLGILFILTFGIPNYNKPNQSKYKSTCS